MQHTRKDKDQLKTCFYYGCTNVWHRWITPRNHKIFTVPNVRDARRSAGYALIFIAILYTTAPAVAAFAKTNLINTVNNVEYSEVPEWFTKWEATNLIRFDDKNGDGRIQYVGDSETNELDVNRDIMVLANPEIAGLPNWVVALVAAGALAPLSPQRLDCFW